MPSLDEFLAMGFAGGLTLSPEEKWLGAFLLAAHDPIPINFNRPSLGGDLLQSPLVEREDCVRHIKGVFNERKKAFLEGSQGRESYRIPVLVGIPGIGKSRLQNEYRQFFSDEEEDSLVVAVFVVYNNGHSVSAADAELPIQVTFAVRMLHAFFQENLTRDAIGFSTIMKHVKDQASVYADLTLLTAFKVIRVGLERLGRLTQGQRMVLYLAIDEYQAIPETKLSQLCQIFLDVSLELRQHNIHLYPLFAGVKWGKGFFDFSSNALFEKVTPRFLSLAGSLEIAASLHPRGLRSAVFLQCLVEIGDHPRLAVRYALDSSYDDRTLPPREQLDVDEALALLRDNILTNHGIGECAGLSSREMLRVVAFAIVGDSVCPGGLSGIQSLTWEQLANRGMFQISSDDRIDLSYAFLFAFYRRSSIQNEFQEGPELYLVKSIRFVIVDLPDAGYLESWQKWVRFGAHYHAIRINAFLVLGQSQTTLKQLLVGPTTTSRVSIEMLDREVRLRPALVFTAQDGLPAEKCDLTSIGENNNETHRVSALDQNICYVFCNGTNSAGSVDIWFTLSRPHAADSFYLIADQRKLDCTPLTSTLLSQLDQSVKQALDHLDLPVISVICSAMSSFGNKKVSIPSNCIAMARRELDDYHGPLVRCVASLTCININTMSKTWIHTHMGCTKEQASAIREKARESPFCRLSEFIAAYHSITSKEIPEEIRERLLLVDDVVAAVDESSSSDDEDS